MRSRVYRFGVFHPPVPEVKPIMGSHIEGIPIEGSHIDGLPIVGSHREKSLEKVVI
jgi:hypothetical protein